MLKNIEFMKGLDGSMATRLQNGYKNSLVIPSCICDSQGVCLAYLHQLNKIYLLIEMRGSSQ